MVRFNVLTFSTGATFAVLFVVLLVGFYPRLTAALFTQFGWLIFVAMASMLLALWGMYTYYYKWDRFAVLKSGATPCSASRWGRLSGSGWSS